MTTAGVYGEVTADGRLALIGEGPTHELARIAARLQLITPAVDNKSTPGVLLMPLTWPAVVQLAEVLGPAWRPQPGLRAWTAEQIERRLDETPAALAVPVTPGFTPRAHQVEGAALIARMGSVLIFDSPRTGKTPTTVLGLRERAAAGHRVWPAVVIVPGDTVADQWIGEFARWAPEVRAVAWRGAPKRRHTLAGTADVYVSTYATVRRDADAGRPLGALLALSPATVVADELHLTKGHHTVQSQAVRRLAAKAAQFIGLSGTPITHALTLDSRLLTPTGWVPMRDVEVGDAVVGSDGLPTRVTEVHPQELGQIFRVWFSDGVSVACTGDHLWAVNSRSRRAKSLPNLVLRTEELSQARSPQGVGGLFDQKGAPRWSIPTVDPVDMPASPVPLDPYLLGTLLANGHLASPPEFVTPDTEIVDYVRAALPAGLRLAARRRSSRQGKADAYRIASGTVGGSLPGPKRGAPPNAVTAALADLGLLGRRAWEKFIPEQYLWNNEAVRLGVLRGLIDGDGCCVGSTTKYDTTSPALAAGVKFLVRSLGGYVTERIAHRGAMRMPQGHNSPARPLHTLYFGVPQNPFRLSRKADRWAPRWRAKGRSIVGVEALGVAPTQCITVAARDGLYVTDDFVVTHNSPADLWPALVALAPGAWPSRERWVTRYCETYQGDYGTEILGLAPHAEDEYRRTILGQHRRVTREDVAPDLPAKTHEVVRVTLPDEAREAYDGMASEMLAVLPDGDEISVMSVLAQLARLQQLAAATCEVTRRIEPGADGVDREHTEVRLRAPSWKVDALLDVLAERPGDSVLVFAPSRQLIMLAGGVAEAAGHSVGYVVGGQKPGDRARDVAAFQAGECRLLLATTGAGGTGLTLSRADTIVFLQRPFWLVESLQSEDRAEGDPNATRGTRIVDILATATIDTRIRAVLRERAGALSDLLQDPRIVAELLGGTDRGQVTA